MIHFPINHKDFPPKAKFPRNEIPKLHFCSMHAASFLLEYLKRGGIKLPENKIRGLFIGLPPWLWHRYSTTWTWDCCVCWDDMCIYELDMDRVSKRTYHNSMTWYSSTDRLMTFIGLGWSVHLWIGYGPSLKTYHDSMTRYLSTDRLMTSIWDTWKLIGACPRKKIAIQNICGLDVL